MRRIFKNKSRSVTPPSGQSCATDHVGILKAVNIVNGVESDDVHMPAGAG